MGICEETRVESHNESMDLFVQSEDVEGEQSEAGRGEQTGLLDAQHRLSVTRQRVDGGVG